MRYKYTDNTRSFVFVTEDGKVYKSMHVTLVPDGCSIEEPDAEIIDYSVLREQAYREESDPMFFKEQRGELPEGSWLAKIEEIKSRWPL